jgi:hypothetical protein
MEHPVFDIFSGRLEKEPMWLETAHSLNEAIERMNQRAQQKPGPYFVYCCQTQQVLDAVDTSAKGQSGASHAA